MVVLRPVVPDGLHLLYVLDGLSCLPVYVGASAV